MSDQKSNLLEVTEIVTAMSSPNSSLTPSSEPKVAMSKEYLDLVTQNGITIATLSLAMLSATRCPIVPLYEMAEEYITQCHDIRQSQNFEDITPKFLLDNKISAKVKAQLDGAPSKVNRSIGFQAPSPETDTSKMN